MDRAGFDPRYNPEFQRGFDPAIHTGPETSQETHERIPSPPGTVLPRIPPVPAPAADRVASPPADGAQTAEAPSDAAAIDRDISPWRNPYVIVLALIGVVLLAAGVGAFRWSVGQVYGGAAYDSGATQAEMEEAMLTAQLAWGLSPLLALAGALTLVGVLFFVALRWRPRRVQVEDEWADESPERLADRQ